MEGKEGERGEEGEEGRGERREAPRKKRELTDVDLSLNRAIKEKKKINPYTAVLPHSYPLKSRGSRDPRSTRRQELDRIEESEREKEVDDPLLGEIKDRLRKDFHRKKGRAL